MRGREPDMKVLITGGCGFIGSHLSEYLADKNYEVIVVDNGCNGHYRSIHQNIRYVEADCTSCDFIKVFSEVLPHYVIHLAAQVDVKTSMNEPVTDAYTNIIGTVKLLDLCREFSVRKFIFASTSAVYGDHGNKPIQEDDPKQPISFYGSSKWAAEQYIQQFYNQFGLSYAIFRYSNVYGPRQRADHEGGVIPIFIKKLINGERPVIFGNGCQSRDFIHIDDVVHANFLALQTGDNIIANISSNTSTSINNLITVLAEHFECAKKPVYVERRSGDILYSRLDNETAKRLIGWQPSVPIDSGIRMTVDAFKHNLRLEEEGVSFNENLFD